MWAHAIEQKRKETTAFQKHLPSSQLFKPPEDILAEEWIEVSTVSQGIEDFSLIFRDILHTQ